MKLVTISWLQCTIVCLFFKPHLMQSPTEERSKAVDFLSEFGYIPEEQVSSLHAQKSGDESDILKSAIQEFQVLNNLSVTGEMDNATAKLMDTPRCGGLDVHHNTRDKRYVVSKDRPKWKKRKLTWTVITDTIPENVDANDLKKLAAKAIAMWAKYADITVEEVPGNADITISYQSQNHNLGKTKTETCTPFTERVFAHAFSPYEFVRRGELHINKDHPPVYLFNTILHEVGHIFGLAHADGGTTLNSVMNSYVQPNADTLQPDDIAGMKDLYSDKKSRSYAHGSYDVEPANAVEPMNPEFCNELTGIDAAFEGPASTIYVLHGKRYTQFSPDRTPISEGSICEMWSGVQTPVQAAYADLDMNQIFFFTDSKYVRFTNGIRDDGFPKLITDDYPLKTPDEPSTIDAAVKWTESHDRVYFIKGNKYYSYPKTAGNVAENVQVQTLPNITPIDAFVRFDNLLYLFQGTNVTAVVDHYFKPIVKDDIGHEFPMSLSTFFRCIPVAFAAETTTETSECECKTNFCCVMLPNCGKANCK